MDSSLHEQAVAQFISVELRGFLDPYHVLVRSCVLNILEIESLVGYPPV